MICPDSSEFVANTFYDQWHTMIWMIEFGRLHELLKTTRWVEAVHPRDETQQRRQPVAHNEDDARTIDGWYQLWECFEYSYQMLCWHRPERSWRWLVADEAAITPKMTVRKRLFPAQNTLAFMYMPLLLIQTLEAWCCSRYWAISSKSSFTKVSFKVRIR